MEYIVDKEIKKKLSSEEESSIAKTICENFKTYNAARQNQLNLAQKIIDEVFLKSQNVKKTDNWKSNIKMCKHYMFFHTLKSFVWKNTYSGINSMFDVSGESLESDNNSNKQKAALVDILEKMSFAKISDTVIDYSLIYGELISFCSWQKRSEEFRKSIKSVSNILSSDISDLPKIIEAKSRGKNFYIDERVIYDNPYIHPVDPANFVFDASQFENFDACPKIHKTFKTPNDIINNRFYSITKDMAQDLRNMANKTPDQSDISNQSAQKMQDNTVNNTCIEVLQHWGDFTLSDGTVLKNWHAVVVAGKYLVKFDKNPFVINPYTFGAYTLDPDTKRGVSPIASILGLAQVQETLMNKTLDLQALNENPPLYSPKGFFEQDEIVVSPGKIINYDPSMYNHSLVKPMTFNSGVYLADITFISDLMSEISGIFPNMAGVQEKGDKTATEISVKTQGQTTRLSMILDVISQNYIIPAVKNVAKLCANFKFDTETVFLKKDNNPENVTITDDIRQAEYRYTYRDRSAIAERLNFADMLIVAIERFAQVLPLDARQVFLWYMEQKGAENPERFLAAQNVNASVPNQGSLDNLNSSALEQTPAPVNLDGLLAQTPMQEAS